MTVGTAPNTSHRGIDALLDAVHECKGGSLLAPVTVLAPNFYASVAARRTLPLVAGRHGAGGVANVMFTTIEQLVRQLGSPGLARANLRLTGPAVEAEIIRGLASQGPDDWARLAAHPATLRAVQRAFGSLRQLSPDALDGLSSQQVRGAEIVRLLVAVRRRLHDVHLADTMDLRREASALLGASGTAGDHLGAVVVMDDAPSTPFDQEVVAALSGRARLVRLPAAPSATATECWECADPEEEARLAVRSVLAAAEAGVPLWRIGVFHPAGATYPRLLHQQLASAGVASHGPELHRLDGTAAGRALLGLLELAGGEWSRPGVMAWLASAPVRTGPDGRPVPVSRWNALSAEAGVVRGLGQWRDRLNRLAARQPADAAEALALADFVEGLAVRCEAGGRRWAERALWAVELLKHYLDADDDQVWPAEQRLGAEQVTNVVLALGELDALDSTADLGVFRRFVRTELESHRLDTRELPGGGVGDGVFVAPFGQAKGMYLDATVSVGLADALVPGHGGDDALLPDELRALDPTGALPTRLRRQQEMADCLGAALAAGAVRRVVTYPTVDPRTGRIQAASRLLATVADDVVVRKVESMSASLRSVGPALSTTELRLRALDRSVGSGRDVTDGPLARSEPDLVRSIGVIRARAGSDFTRFDGLVGAGLVSPFDPTTPVSATRLEVYAECPRRFLFDRVLGIHRRTLPEDLWRIEARDRGSLVHTVLERYVAERIAGAPRSLERLLEIAEGLLDEATAGGMVGKALLWRLDRAAIARDLHVFFAEEGDLQPRAVELAFGDQDGDVPAVTVALGDGRRVHFRGRADRVDEDADGTLVVSDYKTGRQRSIVALRDDPLDGGRRLQLPLYGMAARQALGWDGPVTARYWMVSAEREAARFQLELTDAVERHFAEVVGRIARAVDAGCFPATPGPPMLRGFEGCLWCDFDTVCPATRDRQWAAKRQDAVLGPVIDVQDVDAPEQLPGILMRSLPPAATAGAAAVGTSQ